MPTFQRCPSEVNDLARELMFEFKTHQPLIDAKVRIDYVFALADRDDSGAPKGCALKKNGVRALGIARKLPLKDRALGRADAEIAIDGDWWAEASHEERRALLDHELHHLLVKPGATDDLGRPVIALRAHDFDFGWFKVVASRHGMHSIERAQAKRMMDDAGQYFWPTLFEVNT
jgi:hypothetical protein